VSRVERGDSEIKETADHEDLKRYESGRIYALKETHRIKPARSIYCMLRP